MKVDNLPPSLFRILPLSHVFSSLFLDRLEKDQPLDDDNSDFELGERRSLSRSGKKVAHQISPPPVSFLSVFFPSPSCKERIFTVTCSHKREEKKKLCASHIRFRNSRVLSAQKVHPFSNQAFV